MGPITLTPKQFKAVRPAGNYQAYLRYIGNRRSAVNTNPTPADPYTALIGSAPQPYTPAEIQQQLGQYTAGMPTALTPAQIQSQASSEIEPLIQAVTASITGQAQNASNAVKGYTSDLASKLAAIDFAAPYQQGEKAQAAADNALHQALSGAGTSDAADLSNRLSVINDPSVAAAASDVAGNGVANANANLALGTDAMSNLIADAAAAGSYGQKLPAIAQVAGVQQLAGVGQNATNQIATQTQQIESQLPSILQNLTSTSDSNAANQAQARQQLIQYLSGVNENRSGNLLKLKNDQIVRNDNINANNAKNQTAAYVAQTNANAKVTAAQLAQANKDRSYRLQLAKTLGYDPVTNKPLPGYQWQNGQVGGTIVKTGTTKTGGKTLTPSETLTFVKGLAKTVKVPVTDANGNTQLDSNNKVKYTSQTQFRIPYAQAYQTLTQSGLSDQAARKALNTVYPKGQGGRDWLTNNEQAALKQAKQPSATGTIDIANVGERAYITQAQAAALRAKKQLPNGFWYTADQGHTVYVIKPGY